MLGRCAFSGAVLSLALDENRPYSSREQPFLKGACGTRAEPSAAVGGEGACTPGRAGGPSAVRLFGPLRTGRRFLFSGLLFLSAIDTFHH